MFKKHSRLLPTGRLHRKTVRHKHYWFTIVAANGQTLATSETYTTAAMRDKGMEAVKKVVWNIVSVKQAAKRAGEEARFSSLSTVQFKDDKVKFPRPSDTFHIENKKGKIVKQ